MRRAGVSWCGFPQLTGRLTDPLPGFAEALPPRYRGLAGADLPWPAMDRRHGLFIAVAIGLAAIAGTYAALQTTDLGAQAATTSEKEIAAADVRLDKQEAALRRAAKKRPPRLPKLPGRASAASAASAGGGTAGAGAPGFAASSSGPAPSVAAPAPPPSNSGPGSFDDHGGDRDDAAEAYEDYLDDRADALEDAREDAEDAREDAADAREDRDDD